jgi:hypothetical protein
VSLANHNLIRLLVKSDIGTELEIGKYFETPGPVFSGRGDPFSLAKMTYNEQTGTVIYRSKMTHGKNRKNFQVFEADEFITAITQHIPEKSFQLVRYYG